jgi:amino-acid N-acetyltransferase
MSEPAVSLHQALLLRPLQEPDCQAVADLMAPYARREIMLWRTAAEIARHLPDFVVAEHQGQILGCVALRDYGAGLQEVRSLAVHHDYISQGIGARLVAAIIELARERQCRRLFALTTSPVFFTKQGFQLATKELFPQKVWVDCSACFKKDRCDETAVYLDLGSG